MDFMKDIEKSGNTPHNNDKIGLRSVDATIYGLKVTVLIDTSSTHSFIGDAIAKSLHHETKVDIG